MATDVSTIDTIYSEGTEHSKIIEIQAFGFWIYLMTDLVLFSAIFASHAVLAHNYAAGPTGKDLFNLPYTFGETMVLLFSSATCGLAMLTLQKGRKAQVLLWLAITFFLGLGFIAMEIKEFYQMIQNGHGPEKSAFLSAFFTLVGTHGVHVTFGLIWMATMMGQAAIKGLTMPVRSRLVRFSMFWHFLDIIWIGIFTFVYLMGVM
jgi:cytochrome o ubiquinol oxidase subunit III